MIPTGTEVFAAGLRNTFGLVLHSNVELYRTENGSNHGYGAMQTGCSDSEFIPDASDCDEVNHLVKGGYYGYPNPKRSIVENDPCPSPSIARQAKFLPQIISFKWVHPFDKEGRSPYRSRSRKRTLLRNLLQVAR
jgi:hypothetical protein